MFIQPNPGAPSTGVTHTPRASIEVGIGVCMYVSMCVYVCVYVCVWVCLCMCDCVTVYVCIYVSVCMCMCVCVYFCVCLCMFVYACMCVLLFLCVCMCGVYVCVFRASHTGVENFAPIGVSFSFGVLRNQLPRRVLSHRLATIDVPSSSAV